MDASGYDRETALSTVDHRSKAQSFIFPAVDLDKNFQMH
jgi:hypothetical protein